MKSFAQMLNLRDDPAAIEAYKAHHRAVWPEVLTELERRGIRRMKIYVKGRKMFMFCEADDAFDPAVDFAKFIEAPAFARWEDVMHTLQESTPEAPGEFWTLMEEVFDLETAQGGG